MAVAPPDLSVAIESAVHDALAKVALAISEQHGIQLKRVEYDWVNASPHTFVSERPRYVLLEVSAYTTTIVPRAEA